MSGIVWLVITLSVAGIFLTVLVYRILIIARLPVHLRWELAPVPREKAKAHYGGSYLEQYEWWCKPRRTSRIAPLLYMASEMLMMRGVWKHNRRLWPFSFALHTGIYLVIVMLILQVVNAIFIITGAAPSVRDVFLDVTLIFTYSGYLLGLFGAFGLILMRALSSDLRPFGTFSVYFKLVFLAALFGSGVYGLLFSSDFIAEMFLFLRDIFTLDTGMTVPFPLALHIVISLLFIAYLPLTDMLHFVAKYFTYHKVRWDDVPQDRKMARELNVLLGQPVVWTASHVEPGKAWIDLIRYEEDNEEKT